MKFKLNQNNTKLILIESSRIEHNQLKLWLTRFVHNYRHMKRFKLGVWDGKIDFFKEGFIDFGLWQEIYNCCKEYNFEFKIENKDQFPINKDITFEEISLFANEFFKDHKVPGPDGNPTEIPFIPYDHQIEAIFKIIKYKYCLLEIATAGGKSLVFGTFLFWYLRNINPNSKFLLIVPSIGLVTQFYNDLMDYNLGYFNENKNPVDIRIDEIMSDKPRKYKDPTKEPNIFIGTYQSLEKWPSSWFKQFDVVFTDECHTAKAKTVQSVLSRTFGVAKMRVGMTGTLPTDKSAEILTIKSTHGPVVHRTSAKKLIDKGLISNVKIKALLLHHDNIKFAEGVSKIKKQGDGQRAWQLEREYIHNSDKRKNFIKKLVDKFDSNSLVLFHTIEYGTNLYNFLKDNCQGKDIFYIDGSTKTEKRDYIKKVMEDTKDNTKILVASYGTFSTGQNIKAITNIIFADAFRSDRIIRQSIGRGLRKHKEKLKLIVFDLVDIFHKNYLKTILYRQYKSRRDDIYKKHKYPFDELKIKL